MQALSGKLDAAFLIDDSEGVVILKGDGAKVVADLQENGKETVCLIKCGRMM